jgi:hypothetical protein
MIYIVSGLFRSGTAMMVKAIDEGGIPAAYDEERNRDIIEYVRPDYHPNIHGWMELNRDRYKEDGFPSVYDGKVVKIPFHSLHKVAYCPNGMRVVFMRRDIEEIILSMANLGKTSINLDIGERFVGLIDDFSKRKDVVSVHEFWYSDVLADPLKHFKILAADGWPIDPEKAAQVPDPKHRHINLEDK